MLKILNILIFICFINSCATQQKAPNNYTYKEIDTRVFTLATWQKVTSPTAPYKIYIEGDGNAFNSKGKPTKDPTPKEFTLRKMAFADPAPNVIYIARPCQFIMSQNCSQRHWTTARFAPEVMNSTAEAIKKIANNKPITLIGYSGGAQIAGLIAANKPDLNITKLITIAGNLDHEAWTNYHNLPRLNESMSLNDYKNNYLKFPQTHFVGEDDKIIPVKITKDFLQKDNNLIIIKNTSHNKNWEQAYPKIFNLR